MAIQSSDYAARRPRKSRYSNTATRLQEASSTKPSVYAGCRRKSLADARPPVRTHAGAHEGSKQLKGKQAEVIHTRVRFQTPNGYRESSTTKPPPPPRSWPRGQVKPPHRKWALSAMPAADALRAIRDHRREPISMRGERSNIFNRLCPIIRRGQETAPSDGAPHCPPRPLWSKLR